jgi:chromosomal replication initiator protein
MERTRGRTSGAAAAAGESADPAPARLVEDALRQRLGEERFGVWFGESVTIGVETTRVAAGDETRSGGHHCVVVTAGNVFAQEWLKRTFRADVETVARAVCGAAATVVWRSHPAAVPGPQGGTGDGTTIAAGGRGSRRRAGRQQADAVVARAADAGPRSPTAIVAVPVVTGVPSRRGFADLAGFVVGASNRMAVAAVELAATRPGEMSPLLVHGPSGVGKTHLLEGLCGRYRQQHPGSTALFLSAEQFTTGFLQALHGGGLPGFRRTCRQVSLLVIDDLQFFAGKRATTLELQQTVDAFHRQGRQIVFAADRDLAALDCLGPDLVTRLRGGMTARIEPPDYDVRRGIVAGVAERRGLSLPEEVCHFIATSMTRHARELIGAVNRLEATSHMLGLPVTADMAEESLADLVRSSSRSVRLADIERAVCAAFGLEPGALQSARRARTVNHPRMLAMFLARRHTTSALAEIGSYFGRRSHSTVIAAQKSVDEWMAQRSKIMLADASWDVEDAIRRVEDVLRAG